MGLNRQGFPDHRPIQMVSEAENLTSTPDLNAKGNTVILERPSKRPLSAPLGLTVMIRSVDQQHVRRLDSFLQQSTASSSYTSLQRSRGSSASPKASVLDQLSPALVQDGQSSNGHHHSAKQSHYQRGSDDGEDEDAPSRKRSRAEKISSVFNKKLACPFYRNSPKDHRKYRSCAGPGWTSIHRVKEHIFRDHSLPIYCHRCLDIFTNESEYILHQRQPTPCLLKDSILPEGINKEQQAALRKRRGNTEQSWRAIYAILFPDVPNDLIPSPYYEDDEVQLELLQRRESNRFQRHMEFAIPRSVRRFLEQTSFEAPAFLDVLMRTQLVEIVARAVAEASQSYQQRGSSPTETQAPAVPNVPPTFTQHPQTPGAPDSILYLPTSTLTHEPLQPQTNVQQHGGLDYGLDHSTSVPDGKEHQDNDSRPGDELLVYPSILDMSLFGWNPNQDALFQSP